MEVHLTWETHPKTRTEWLRDAEMWTFRAFLWFRNIGHQRRHAIENGAEVFGISPRRFRSFIEGEPITVDHDEYERLCRGQQRHLEERARILAADLEAINEELKQSRLGLETDMGRHRENASEDRRNSPLAGP